MHLLFPAVRRRDLSLSIAPAATSSGADRALKLEASGLIPADLKWPKRIEPMATGTDRRLQFLAAALSA